MPRIPLIEDLTRGAVPAGSNLLVEFDPSSQWHNAHVAMAASWLMTGGKVVYHIAAQPRERVRDQLRRLGVGNVEELEGLHEKDPKLTLTLNDWYSATIGRKTQDHWSIVPSLKVADLSIEWAQGEKEISGLFQQPGPPVLRILDNVSCLARFNDEKAWVEFVITRLIPRATKWNQVTIIGLMRGLHSDWVYKNLEGTADGVIDFRLEEATEETQDLMRIRSMRSIGFDRKWHQLNVAANSEVTLEKSN